jgi:hypothetical protein
MGFDGGERDIKMGEDDDSRQDRRASLTPVELMRKLTYL